MKFLKKLMHQREFMIFGIVVGMFIIMSFASSYFLSSGNLLALLLILSIEALIAVAMTNLMVSGGFDMSVGSLVAFTGGGDSPADEKWYARTFCGPDRNCDRYCGGAL